MKREILVWLKQPFLLVYWFFKRIISHLSLIGERVTRFRKKIYETHIAEMLKSSKESPLNHQSVAPWHVRVSGTVLVLSKYLSLLIYSEARSYRWQEIYGFILGKKLGDLFVGITYVPVTNKLRSSIAAEPDLYHLLELENMVASRYPELDIVGTCHSHPSGCLIPSEADIKCFKRETTPNLIISPRRLLFGSPLKRMVAYHNFLGKIRRIKIFENDKKEPELKDIDFKELQPSKEELVKMRELTTEIDFDIYKIWLVSHPNLSLKNMSKKLSEIFGKNIVFNFLYKEKDKGGIVSKADMKVIDYFLQDGDHLVLPEFFEETTR